VRRRRPGRLRSCSGADRASVGALSRGARDWACLCVACLRRTGRAKRPALSSSVACSAPAPFERRSRPRPRRAGRLNVPGVSVIRAAQRAWRHPFATSAVPAAPSAAEKAVQLLPERRLDHVPDVRPEPALDRVEAFVASGRRKLGADSSVFHGVTSSRGPGRRPGGALSPGDRAAFEFPATSRHCRSTGKPRRPVFAAGRRDIPNPA